MDMQLDQLKSLNTEIEILREQIRNTESRIMTDVVTGSDIEYPHLERNQYITGLCYNQNLKRLQRKLSNRLGEILIAREQALDWINSIEDSEMRQILILRYVDGLSWQRIAVKLGRAGDGSTERKKHDRFLKEIS